MMEGYAGLLQSCRGAATSRTYAESEASLDLDNLMTWSISCPLRDNCFKLAPPEHSPGRGHALQHRTSQKQQRRAFFGGGVAETSNQQRAWHRH